jgi:membrane protein
MTVNQPSRNTAKQPVIEHFRRANLSRAWSLGGLSKTDLARAVLRSSDEHDLPGRAAQLSFFLVLALFPLLIFVSAILGKIFAAENDLYARLLQYLGAIMPWSAFELVQSTVNDIVSGSSGGEISFGLLMTLWTGSSGMVATIECLNIAYRVPEKRKWWRRRIVAIVLTICMGLLAGFAITLITAGDAAANIIGSVISDKQVLVTTSTLAQWVIAGCSMLAGLLMIYRFAPNLPDQGVEAVLPGAIVALAGWLLASSVFRLYLSVFNSFNRTYGSLGAVIVLLLWLYLSAASVLLGGEVNSAIRAARRRSN